MRIFTILLGLILTGCVAGNGVPATDVEQVHEAEELIRYSLTGRLMDSLRQRTEDRFSALLTAKGFSPEAAEKTLSEEFSATVEIEEQRLLETLVPIYRRYYTAEEIHELLSFYQTEVARKSLKVSGLIAADAQEYIRLWHEHFEDQLLKRIDKRLAEEGLSID